jgi:glucose/arabinose dehydrogenase
MSPKNYLPLSSLLLLALLLLPSCGGGLASTPNPPTPGSNPAPSVASITPNTGTTSGGTTVTIMGTGFLSGAAVKVGGTSATGITVVNGTSITATTPAHAAGAVNVVVTNTDAQSGTMTGGYTYTTPPPANPAPTVTSITPNTGPTSGATAVTIMGTGFLAGATVKLGGTSATGVTVVNSTSITATTPAHAAGAVSVVVTNTDAKSGTLTNGYTYPAPPAPAPTVATITPNSGTTNGGTAVTITGTGFLAGASVKMGGTSATVLAVVNSAIITATAPAHTAGAVDVVVTNTDTKSGTLTNGYTYTVPSGSNPAPTVTVIAPNSGVTTGGTTVTITGTGFLAGATVKLGGTSATSVALVNSTTITAATPAHAAGAVSVVVTNTDAKTGTLTNGYTYTTPAGTLALSNVVSGLSNPVGMERPPGDNRFFIVEQRGTIRILENGALQSGNFLDLQSLVNFDGQEQGLLGLAFHPNYATNHKFYVNYSLDQGNRETVIAEYQTLASDPNTADPNSERVLLIVNQPFPNHKGGQLVFGPDGFLYIGLGDGGSGGDPLGNGQNLSTFLGKMLRISVDPPFATGKEYAIPADNPFAASGGLPEIWAYGLRNPWRFSFEPVTNRLFVADVGQDNWEEIDILQKGGNFGWNVMEGKHCFPPTNTTCDMTNKILPITEYPHTDGVAIIGGYIYKGSAIPSLANKYIFADLTGKIWSLTEAPANTWTRADMLGTNLTLTSFGRDAAGELYLVDYNGNILKLVLQ